MSTSLIRGEKNHAGLLIKRFLNKNPGLHQKILPKTEDTINELTQNFP